MIRIYLAMAVILLGNMKPSYPQSQLPDTNIKIIQFVQSVIGISVGRGECWDLADQALTSAGAQFDKTSKSTIYIFGERYNPERDPILPGDIIQFENVTVTYQDGNMIFTENYAHHTAIVYSINEDGSLKLAHQNTSFGGRKVALSDFKLVNVKKGKLHFYRPIPG